MSDPYCPNIEGCRLVNDPSYPLAPEQKASYLECYCMGTGPGFESCRRYTAKRELFFCPDFVLPDTRMTKDEILDRIESLP